jgi:VanZ family protein
VGPDANEEVKTRFFEYQLPVLMWLVATFLFSTDAFSAKETSKFILPVLTYLFPAFSSQQIDFGHLLIRKFAHITEYFILSLLAYRCFKYDQTDVIEAKVKTITFILLAALLDELHQWFTASRGASIVDVGYDCLGAVWALWLINIYETRYLRSHSIL